MRDGGREREMPAATTTTGGRGGTVSALPPGEGGCEFDALPVPVPAPVPIDFGRTVPAAECGNEKCVKVGKYGNIAFDAGDVPPLPRPEPFGVVEPLGVGCDGFGCADFAPLPVPVVLIAGAGCSRSAFAVSGGAVPAGPTPLALPPAVVIDVRGEGGLVARDGIGGGDPAAAAAIYNADLHVCNTQPTTTKRYTTDQSLESIFPRCSRQISTNSTSRKRQMNA